MKPRASAIASAWTVILTLMCVGCGSDAPPADDEVEIVPFASTLVLDDDALSKLDTDADGMLTFSETPASLTDLSPGRVVVASKSDRTPHGLLRVVKSVRADEAGLQLETLQAPLQLAFRKIHLKTTPRHSGELAKEPFPPPNGPLSYDPFKRHVGATQALHAIIFDGDGDESTDNDQVRVDGELGGSIDFSFQLDFDWGALDDLPKVVNDCLSGLLEGQFDCSLLQLLPEAKATLEATPSLASHIELSGAAILDFDREVTLLDLNVAELVYPPVVITPNVRIIAHAQGEASATFEESVDAAVDFGTSVTVSSRNPDAPKFEPPRLRSVSFDAKPPEVTLAASARAALGAELNMLIYGVSGPFLKAEAFGEVKADVFRDPCVELHAGLQGSLGVKVTTPAILFINPIDLLDYHVDFDPIDQKLDVDVPPCKAPSRASMLPPGAGPDADHLADPDFEPWSRSLDAPFEAIGLSPGGFSFFVDQTRSIDDRIVVAGRGANALTKLDQNGDLVWARSLVRDAGDITTKLRPVRSIAGPDASLFVLAEGETSTLALIRLSQAGNVLQSRDLDVPDSSACGLRPVGLGRDGADGLNVVFSCDNEHAFYVMRLNQALDVTSAQRFADDSADALAATVARDVGSELFVGGRISARGDAMFGVRLKADGSLGFAKRYVACPAGPDVYPISSLVEANGDVTVAGRGGAEHNGFLARIRRDGKVGFAAFPGFGFGVGSVFVLDGIAELPTTGYVVSASTVRFTADELSAVPALALLQLDAVGKPVWARRYTLLDDDGAYLPSSQSALTLSDDGGILVSAMSARAGDPLNADSWSMKVFAKDGSIELPAKRAAVAELDRDPDNQVVALDCDLTAENWNVAVTGRPLFSRPTDTRAGDFSTHQRVQAP